MAAAIPKPPNSAAVSLERLSDRALFVRAASDEAAFAVIVNRYREPLRRHAARYVGDADAEDVVQQAFVNASLALRREPDRDIEPKPWLYKVTTNAAIDHRRAASARPLADRPRDEVDVDALGGASAADPHEVATGRESIRSMVTGIQGLAPNQRRAATARFLEGRSHDEIAADLGVTKGAARELIHRARRNLREAIPALSPVPLFVKLRESIAGLFAGSGAAGTAKLTAGAATVVVAAGAGGFAINEIAKDRDRPAPRAEPAAGTAAPAAGLPKVGAVAERPRSNSGSAGGAARGDGKGNGGGRQDGGGSGSGSGGNAGAGTPSDPVTAGSASASAGGTESADTPVDSLSEQVGQTADELGQTVDELGQTADELGAELGSELGIDAPSLPSVPEVELPGTGGLLGNGN